MSAQHTAYEGYVNTAPLIFGSLSCSELYLYHQQASTINKSVLLAELLEFI